MNVDNQVCIIGGGASGMGAATAKHLTSLGAKVAIFDRDLERAEKVADDIGGLAVACDITQSDHVIQSVALVKDKLDVPRVCVNCAGVAPAARIVGKKGPQPLDEFANAININLIGTFNLMRIVAHAMSLADPVNKDGERGVIINTASIAAFEGQVGQAAYSASKGGVVAMTLPAARELAHFGIRVMAIAPGLINTPMFAGMSDEIQADLTANIPFPKRLGNPSEYAHLVQHIIENPMLNGDTIRLDAALRLT